MHIKKFEATSMSEALRQVRAELGPDALVLSSRSVRRDRGWFGRLGKPVVEVTAAIDRDLVQTGAGASASEGAPARVAPDPSWQELRLTRALVDPLEAEVRSLREAVDGLRLRTETPPSLAEEIAEVRRMAADVLYGSPGCGRGGDAAGRSHAGRLLSAGLAPRHAFVLASEAVRLQEDPAAADPTALGFALATRLDDRLRPPREDDAPVVLYVGATGVGKTTTLAKVATRGALRGRRARGVALLSADAHRMGADAALRSYARRLDAPFEVALSAEGLARGVEKAGRRQVLIDTAGRAPSDEAGLAELLGMREALGRKAAVHLVLAATTKEEDLRAELRRHAPLRPDAVVITKLDESRALGNVANLLLDESAPPLAWIGEGQRVPEDLAVPDPEDLARRVLEAAA